MKKQKVLIITIVLALVFLIFGVNVFTSLKSYINYEIEEKNVWLTSDVECGSDADRNKTNCYVRYDDHNGEKGILYVNYNENGYKDSDYVVVYRNKAKGYSNDSTHNWTLIRPKKEASLISCFLSLIICIVDAFFLLKNVKKLKSKNS